MIRRFFIAFLFLSVHTALSAQVLTARQLFLNLPDSLFQLLTDVNRADCIDFLESNMKAKVTNKFNTPSEMTQLNDSYIQIQLTEHSNWQMKVLSVNDSTQVICTAMTYEGPVKDSQIRFYDTAWQELDTHQYIPEMPRSADAFITSSPQQEVPEEFSIWKKSLDMLLMQAELSADSDSLLFTFTTPDYVDTETAEKLEPFLCRTMKFCWNNSCFKPCNEQ